MTMTVEPAGGRPPTTAAEAAAPAPRTRDRFLDVLRLFVMVLVVSQHWWLPVLSVQTQGELSAGSVLSSEAASRSPGSPRSCP